MSRMARQYQGVRAKRILERVEPENAPPNAEEIPAKIFKPANNTNLRNLSPRTDHKCKGISGDVKEIPAKELKDGLRKISPLQKPDSTMTYKNKIKPSTPGASSSCQSDTSTISMQKHKERPENSIKDKIMCPGHDDVSLLNLDEQTSTTLTDKTPKQGLDTTMAFERTFTEASGLECVLSVTTNMEKSIKFDVHEKLLLKRLIFYHKNNNLESKCLSVSDLTIDKGLLKLEKRSKSLSSLLQYENLWNAQVLCFNLNDKKCEELGAQYTKIKNNDDGAFLTLTGQVWVDFSKQSSLSTTDLTEDQSAYCNNITKKNRSVSAPPSTSMFNCYSDTNNFTYAAAPPEYDNDGDAAYQSAQDAMTINCDKEEEDRSGSPSVLVGCRFIDDTVYTDSDSDYDPLQDGPITDCDSEEEIYGDMAAGRKRRHVARNEEWKRNKAKLLRMRGEEYMGYSKDEADKFQQNQQRYARQLGQSCNSQFCFKSKLRGCSTFDEQTRQDIHTHFWKRLDWNQRKVYVGGLAVRVKTKGKRTSKETSRRQETLKYFLPKKDDAGVVRNVQVCQLMFLNTLSLKSTCVKEWTKENVFSNSSMQDNTGTGNQLHRRKQAMISYLSRLPKMPSHYARKNTRKLFLEPIFQTVTDVYKAYKEHCNVLQEAAAVSRYTFDNEFKKMNLSIFTLKKDMCDICVSHKEGNYDEHDYQMHIIRKNRAREEKEKDKKDAAKGELILLTMDLEAVKVCPYLKASALYFKTKLTCHNFTLFDLTTRQCTCYWFNETAADMTASTFASFVLDYLERHCVPKQKPIVIYSDGCTYQNRNVILANALLNFSIKHKVTVTQKFLESGHTQMECDSVHSAIERKLTNREIHLPSDYVTVTKEARTINPYEVIQIDHTFIKNYADSSTWLYKSIRPGRKAGDPTVTDIRVILYNQEETLKVKLHFDDDWLILPLRPKQANPFVEYPCLHENMIPITSSKFKHLQELKQVLPPDCHLFYDALPHDPI